MVGIVFVTLLTFSFLRVSLTDFTLSNVKRFYSSRGVGEWINNIYEHSKTQRPRSTFESVGGGGDHESVRGGLNEYLIHF